MSNNHEPTKNLVRALAIGAALLVTLGVEGAAMADITTTPKSYWSESHAEQMVLGKVRVPCMAVFGPNGATWMYTNRGACSLAGALKAVTAAEKGGSGTVDAILTLDNAKQGLSYAQDGVPLTKASCNGTGLPDKSGYRFATLTCRIAVLVHPAQGCLGNGCRDTNVSGRIVVYVTGPATFRWKLI